MKFKDKEEMKTYFDNLINLFHSKDIEGYEIELTALTAESTKEFISYLYKNKEILGDNSYIMFRLALNYLQYR